MEKESEYIDLLKNFLTQVQNGFGRLDPRAKEQLVKETKMSCPDKEEKRLLEDLIAKADEYTKLQTRVKEQKSSSDETEKYFSYRRWFNSINMLLDTFDVPLHEVSFSDLTLKEQV